MATFTWIPSQQVLDQAPPVLNAPFGDGYEQRVGDGVAPVGRSYTLTFRRQQDLDAVEGFVTAHFAVDTFTWTPYGESAASFICRTWQRNNRPGGAKEIVARFERVYV